MDLTLVDLTLVEATRPGGDGATERRFLDFAVDGERLGLVALRAGTDAITGLWLGGVEPGRSSLLCLLGKTEPDAPGGRTSIFVCPECADLGCGHITAVVDVGSDVVTWTQFGYQNNYEDEVDLLGVFSDLTFERDQYEQVLGGVLEREFSSDRNDDQRERWNTDQNPAVEGDQFVAVAAVNFAVRTFRKVRAKLSR